MAYRSLRDFIAALEARGELVRVTEPVSSVLEITEICTRLRREDSSLVLLDISFDEREMLMEAEPATFHFTAHYKDYPSVLARLETIDPGSLRNFLERRWRKVAPKAVIKAYDADARTPPRSSS